MMVLILSQSNIASERYWKELVASLLRISTSYGKEANLKRKIGLRLFLV